MFFDVNAESDGSEPGFWVDAFSSSSNSGPDQRPATGMAMGYPLACDMCGITQLSGDLQAKQHFEGKNHLKEVRKKAALKTASMSSASTYNPAIARPPPGFFMSSDGGAPSNTNDLSQQHTHVNYTYGNFQNYCSTCDKTFSGPEPARQHFIGRSHLRAVEKAQFHDSLSQDETVLYCEVCHKQFSGEIPAAQHFKSKLHEKAVEAASKREQLLGTRARDTHDVLRESNACDADFKEISEPVRSRTVGEQLLQPHRAGPPAVVGKNVNIACQSQNSRKETVPTQKNPAMTTTQVATEPVSPDSTTDQLMSVDVNYVMQEKLAALESTVSGLAQSFASKHRPPHDELKTVDKGRIDGQRDSNQANSFQVKRDVHREHSVKNFTGVKYDGDIRQEIIQLCSTVIEDHIKKLIPQISKTIADAILDCIDKSSAEYAINGRTGLSSPVSCPQIYEYNPDHSGTVKDREITGISDDEYSVRGVKDLSSIQLDVGYQGDDNPDLCPDHQGDTGEVVDQDKEDNNCDQDRDVLSGNKADKSEEQQDSDYDVTAGEEEEEEEKENGSDDDDAGTGDGITTDGKTMPNENINAPAEGSGRRQVQLSDGDKS